MDFRKPNTLRYMVGKLIPYLNHSTNLRISVGFSKGWTIFFFQHKFIILITIINRNVLENNFFTKKEDQNLIIPMNLLKTD